MHQHMHKIALALAYWICASHAWRVRRSVPQWPDSRRAASESPLERHTKSPGDSLAMALLAFQHPAALNSAIRTAHLTLNNPASGKHHVMTSIDGLTQRNMSEAEAEKITSQLVRQGDHDWAIKLGMAEGVLLKHAPHLPWPAPSIAALRDDGAILVPNVLSDATAASLRNYCESRMAQSLAAVASNPDDEPDHFTTILTRKERHDLKLDLEPPVVDALVEALKVLGPFIRGVYHSTLQSDELYLNELGAIRSTEGAPRQPLHSDTPWADNEGEPSILTMFVALQDVDEQMGPTMFLPGTHLNEPVQAEMIGTPQKANVLRSSPRRLGIMPAGACTLYDSRLIHAGGANDSPRGRWLFHASFAASKRLRSSRMINYGYDVWKLGVHSLHEVEMGAVRSEDDLQTIELKEKWYDKFFENMF